MHNPSPMLLKEILTKLYGLPKGKDLTAKGELVGKHGIKGSGGHKRKSYGVNMTKYII